MECVFCKIVKGDIPAYKVYEDEKTLAFLDINPVAPGHLLVIPKRHYERITEIPEEDSHALFSTVRKLAKKIEEKLSKDYNIIINHGRLAGQVINHVHVHIIPRYGQEQLFLWQTHKLSEEEAKKVLELLSE